MDAITHTLISVSSLLAFFLAGEFFGKRKWTEISDEVVSFTLNMLERDGLIRTETDKFGEKEIIPISEIVAETLKNAKPTPQPKL